MGEPSEVSLLRRDELGLGSNPAGLLPDRGGSRAFLSKRFFSYGRETLMQTGSALALSGEIPNRSAAALMYASNWSL